jgi:hypothetical protein
MRLHAMAIAVSSNLHRTASCSRPRQGEGRVTGHQRGQVHPDLLVHASRHLSELFYGWIIVSKNICAPVLHAIMWGLEFGAGLAGCDPRGVLYRCADTAAEP